MTEKVAELLKQALELTPEARSALASSLLASLEEASVDEDVEARLDSELSRGSMARVAEVRFHPETAAEFDFAVDWYLERSEQAAREFLREVDDAVASIAANPQRWTE